MGILAHMAHVGRMLALLLCVTCTLAYFPFLASSAQARPRLFGTVEFQMELRNLKVNEKESNKKIIGSFYIKI